MLVSETGFKNYSPLPFIMLLCNFSIIFTSLKFLLNF